MDLTQYDEKTAGNGMNQLRMGGFIFLGVGLLFFVLGAVFLASYQKKAMTYVETKGVIVDFDRNGYPYVAYEVYGKAYEQRSNFTSSSMRLGDEMTVRYNPLSPDRIELSSFASLFLPILFMGMGGLSAVIGIFCLRFFRKEREPEDPWASPQT